MKARRAILSMGLIVAASVVAQAFTLVENGKAKATIVCATPQTRSVQTAATDLRDMVKRITGARLPIYPDTRPVKGPVILIGPSKRLAEYGVDASGLRLDNCLIRSGENFLAIVGRDADAPKGASHYRAQLNGTANGVYKFLEDYCDVRICMPGRNGMVAPERKTLAVPDDINVRFEKTILSGNPGFKGSGYSVALRWRWRGMPGVKTKSHGGHGWTDAAIRPELYAEKHPEFYPLVKGKRRPDLGVRKSRKTGAVVVNAGLCTTNPKVRQITLDYLKKQLEIHDGVEFGGPDWNNRNGGFKCECPECMNRASYAKYWKEFGGLPACFGRIDRYLDQRIWEYNLWLARKVYAWNPKKKFFITSYQYTWRALPGMNKQTFPPNVVMQVADLGTFMVDYKKLDEKRFPNCTPGPRLAWMKAHNQFSVYTYLWFPWRSFGPGPKESMKIVAAQHKLFAQCGVRMLYYCSRPINWGLEGVQYYLDYRLRMDGKADPRAVLTEYCDTLYGPAARQMQAFYEELEDVLNTGQRMREKGVVAVYSERWSEANVDRVMKRLAVAERAAAGDDLVSARISLSRAAMDWVDRTAKVCRLWKASQEKPTPDAKAAWEAAVKERVAWIDGMVTRMESGHYKKLGLPDPFDRFDRGDMRAWLVSFRNRGKHNVFETRK